MQFPKFPDWLIYSTIAGAILLVAHVRGEDADAPAPPPPVTGEASIPIGPASPFDPATVVEIPQGSRGVVGTAFSVAARGVWLTASDVVEGCRRVVLVVAPGRGVEAKVEFIEDDAIAVLTTAGGTSALALGDAKSLRKSQRGFHPGFPQGAPGEASSRYLGPSVMAPGVRGKTQQPVLIWARTGQTEDLRGGLSGLAGAPVLDGRGRVVGVTLAASSRRGVLYSTDPKTVQRAVAAAGERPAAAGIDRAVTVDNYGLVADVLRRGLSVVEVKCLRR